MIEVNRDLCTGCASCLSICSVDAISITDGCAAIDPFTCNHCGACIEICPTGALSAEKGQEPATPISVPLRSVQPTELQLKLPKQTPSWRASLLAFAGREIFPKLVDHVFAAIDRRISIAQRKLTISSYQTLNLNPNHGIGLHRRRLRHRQHQYKGNSFE